MTSRGPGGDWGPDDGWGTGGRAPVNGDPGDERTDEDAPATDGAPTDAPQPRLAPMPITTLLEVAGRIIRRHAMPLLAVSALFQLPSSITDAAGQQRLARALSAIVVGLDTDTPRVLEPTNAQSQAIVEALVVVTATSIFGMLLGAIATLAFTTAALDDYQGRRPSVRGMVVAALRRAVPALAAGLLAALLLLGIIVAAAVLAVGAMALLPAPGGGAGGFGAFLAILVGVSAVVLAIVVMVRLALPAAVLAGERVGAVEALRRSWHLTSDNTWRAFVVLAVVTIVVAILGSTLLELLAVVVTDGIAAGMGLADVSDALLSGLVSTLMAPIGGVVLAVLYLDLRVRRDGWQPLTPSPQARVNERSS